MYSYHNGLIFHRSSRPFNRGSVPPCLHVATVVSTMEGIAIGILVAYPLTNNVGNGFLEFAALSSDDTSTAADLYFLLYNATCQSKIRNRCLNT